MLQNGERKFRVMCRITIFALFSLILAGGVVRSSGSGMGCPDWPKCFDRYVPPVAANQLPADYKQRYVERRVQKNQHFAKTLDLLGYGEMANRIRNDESIREPEDFNAVKTWTEYINRLIGAITGFFMIGCAVFSASYFETKRRIFILSLLNLFLVGFQGWLGSIVVSTHLLAWVVTVHMLTAIAIVAICIFTFYDAKYLLVPKQEQRNTVLRIIALITVLLTVFQITTGTEVREQIDAIAAVMNNLNRGEWVAKTGTNFNFHRDMAISIVLVNVALIVSVARKFGRKTVQFQYSAYVGGILLLQILMGVSLAYFSLPGYAQAAHVTLAALLFGAQFYLLLLLKWNTTPLTVA